MQLHAFHPLSYSMGGAVQRFTVNSKFFQLLRHPLMQKYFPIVMIAKPSDSGKPEMHLHARFCTLLNGWNWVWPYCAFEILKNVCECSLLHCIGPLPAPGASTDVSLGVVLVPISFQISNFPPCIKIYSFFELQLHLSSVLWVDPKFGFQISWGLHAKIYKLKMHCPQPSSLYLCALWNWLKLFAPGMLITLCRDVMLGRHVTHFWWVGI